ncbi:MAG: glnE, partial [Hyphomicrobiales bacterium]|nr:glnE [Hyphomicrobiales bacterium]
MSAAKRSKPKPEDRTLVARIVSAPLVQRASVAGDKLKDLIAGASRISPLLAKPAPPLRALLSAVADHSPYLWSLASADPRRLSDLLASVPETRFDTCLEQMRRGCEAAVDDEAMLHTLRLGKQEGHLLIALCDLAGIWSVDDVMMAVTRLADCATRCATRYALRQAHKQNRLKLADPADPERGCGFVLLALGKHGAMELNYSSDIDLVAFFDPQTPALLDPANATTIYVRVTQLIARLLQERTGDGYAFRVDLRLRPDPGSTAVAVSLPSAFSYYENLGQNWERAAFIKARAVAGEISLGESFLKDMTPFLWRRYFDYAAIADIHAMKRQIHAVRGYADIADAGHNIKLGRGGIREVEFFVLTQQLIFGGRRPNLRGARTLEMLRELAYDVL